MRLLLNRLCTYESRSVYLLLSQIYSIPLRIRLHVLPVAANGASLNYTRLVYEAVRLSCVTITDSTKVQLRYMPTFIELLLLCCSKLLGDITVLYERLLYLYVLSLSLDGIRNYTCTILVMA
jgi:hypothetical protein